MLNGRFVYVRLAASGVALYRSIPLKLRNKFVLGAFYRYNATRTAVYIYVRDGMSRVDSTQEYCKELVKHLACVANLTTLLRNLGLYRTNLTLYY
jgi:hypothetical protein